MLSLPTGNPNPAHLDGCWKHDEVQTRSWEFCVTVFVKVKVSKMHKKLVRSSAIREDSPVRSPVRRVVSKGDGSPTKHVSRTRVAIKETNPRVDSNRNVSDDKSDGNAKVTPPAASGETNVTLEHKSKDTAAVVIQDRQAKVQSEHNLKRSEPYAETKPESREKNTNKHVQSTNKVDGDVFVSCEKVKQAPFCCNKHKRRELGETGFLVKQSCVEVPDISRLTIKSDSLPERTLSCFVHPEIARVRSMGDVPMSAGAFHSGYIERQDSLRAVTVHEEDVPVIVRRRGCTLRVRITSFHEDGEEWFPVGGQMVLPIHVRIPSDPDRFSRFIGKSGKLLFWKQVMM